MTTLSDLIGEINSLLPTNTTGEISPSDLRTVLIDMAAQILADVDSIASIVTSGTLNLGDQVLMVVGDSTMQSGWSTADQNAAVASYTASPLIHVMNQDGAFVQYTPGTMAGLNHLANSPLCGPELQFVQRWKSRFPTKDLYICKCAAG